MIPISICPLPKFHVWQKNKNYAIKIKLNSIYKSWKNLELKPSNRRSKIHFIQFTFQCENRRVHLIHQRRLASQQRMQEMHRRLWAAQQRRQEIHRRLWANPAQPITCCPAFHRPNRCPTHHHLIYPNPAYSHHHHLHVHPLQ